MNEKIGLFWLRDDFRIKKNFALSEATKNHKQVVAFYLFKSNQYKKQEAQQWWISKSLQDFTTQLNNLNIKLEIIKTESYKQFFEKLILKKTFQFIGTKFMSLIILNLTFFFQKFLKKKIYIIKFLREIF